MLCVLPQLDRNPIFPELFITYRLRISRSFVHVGFSGLRKSCCHDTSVCFGCSEQCCCFAARWHAFFRIAHRPARQLSKSLPVLHQLVKRVTSLRFGLNVKPQNWVQACFRHWSGKQAVTWLFVCVCVIWIKLYFLSCHTWLNLL